MFGLFPFLQRLFADAGYQGRQFATGTAEVWPDLVIAIVQRSDTAKGFKLLPRRWVVERTFAWLNRCRRLARDCENPTSNALAFLTLASIRLMPGKLCNTP
jgi:transposase